MYAVVEGAAKVKLSGNLRTTVSQRTHDKRAKFHGCSLYKRESIIQAAEHAQAMATESYKYVKDMSYFATLRYRKWFGPYSQSRRMHVEDTLRKLSHNDQFARATYVCECDDDPNAPDDGGETRAYTGTHILQPRDRYSTTDKSLDQKKDILEYYGSVNHSGIIGEGPGEV